MAIAPAAPEDRFAELVELFIDTPGVTPPQRRRRRHTI